MRRRICVVLLVLLTSVASGPAQSPSELGASAFDFIQIKRAYARQLWTKDSPTQRDLTSAARMLREILVYLDRPDVTALQESNQNLKSQRADVRYELSKVLTKAGRREEALWTLSQLADEAMSSVYADWLESEIDKIWFAQLRDEDAFKAAIEKMRHLDRFGKLSTLNTPYRPEIGEDERVAGLSLFWSMARTSFVYFDRVPELDWDKAYLEYLPKVRAAKTTYEYYRLLQQMCALLKDGHTNVYLPMDLLEEMAARPPLRTRLVERRLIVERVLSSSLRAEGIVPGVELLTVDGMPVMEYAEKHVRPFQSSSTRQDSDLRTFTYELLAGPKNKNVVLGLRDPAGKLFSRGVARTGHTHLESAAKKPFEFKVLNGNIGYVALNSFASESVVNDFRNKLDPILATDALVIDIRNNDGGNSDFGDEILSHLINIPTPTARWRSRQFRPLLRSAGIHSDWYGEAGPMIQPHRTKNYSRPVVLLIGNRTFSAGEDFAMVFDYANRGPLIGEPTGGSTGQPMSFGLPGGGRARICVKRDSYPDGKQFVGVGVLPDVTVVTKISDVAGGSDSVLEAALLELKGKLAAR